MIKTAKEFRQAQERAAAFQNEGGAMPVQWPTDKDLIRVLKSYKGPVCVEVLTKNCLYRVQVVKSDLIKELKDAENSNSACQFSILRNDQLALILTSNHYIR